jgi:hypothetical protein
MLWDKGTYDTDGSGAEQLKRGELKFTLHGQKLKGGFVLIRTGRGSVAVRAPLASDQASRQARRSVVEH